MISERGTWRFWEEIQSMNELILKLGEFFVPAVFVLILKDFFDLFLSNRRSAKLEQYSVWVLYFFIDRVISINEEFR